MRGWARRTTSMTAAALVLGGLTSTENATAVQRPTCQGQPATVVGTAGSDELEGTDGIDVVVGLGGDDFVFTGRGHDLVCLGEGFDVVRLGPGRDRAFGGSGDDTLTGEGGVDRLRGQGDVDALSGGAGDDTLFGGRGSGIVVEGLLGGPGDDVLVGGAGLDSAHFYDAADPVRVDLKRGRATGDGRDKLVGIEGAVGSRHDDVILGDAAGNGLFGQGGDDLIRSGNSGRLVDGTSDVISGDQGDDDLFGGAGEDLLIFSRIPVAVTVDLAAGVATGQGTDELAGMEAVQGSVLADSLTGGSGDDLLAGHLGDDVIDGSGGTDTVIYRDVIGPVRVRLAAGSGTGEAAGTDTLAGMENIWGTNARDDLRGDDGPNVILAFGGNDRLTGFDGVDLLDGSAGTDTCVDDAAETVNCESPDPTT